MTYNISVYQSLSSFEVLRERRRINLTGVMAETPPLPAPALCRFGSMEAAHS